MELYRIQTLSDFFNLGSIGLTGRTRLLPTTWPFFYNQLWVRVPVQNKTTY